jgi:hypothetical protein
MNILIKTAIASLMAVGLLTAAESNTTQSAASPFTGKIQQLAVENPLFDPAYNLPIDKKSKFLCEGVLENGKTAYFVSVKAMMLVYNHQDYFIKHKLLEDKIKTIYVHDYLTGKKIEAQKAVYVFGSRLIGPHGDDLIPLASEEKAKLFEMKYGGHKILPFERLDKGLIRYLDM